MVAAIQLEQLANTAGIAVKVTCAAQVQDSVHCVFTDALHNNTTGAADKAIISAQQIADTVADGAGKKVFTVFFSETAYETIVSDGGSKVNFKATSAANGSTVLNGLTYLQDIPFSIVSLVDGIEKANLTLQLDNQRYKDNQNEYNVEVTVYQEGEIMVDENGVEIDYGIVYGAPDASGEVKITIGGALGRRLPVGTYEVAATVSNSIGSITHSQVVTVTTNPGNVEATSFNTFDASGPMFQLEYGAKDYSGYAGDLTLVGDITQKGNTSVLLGVSFEIIDICGVTFDASAVSEFVMDASIAEALNPIDVDGGYDGEKFNLALWIIGSDASGQQFKGPVTESSFWLDEKLATPVVALDSIDWTTGAQKISVVEDGSYNEYESVYDLSGTEYTETLDVSGNEKAYGDHTFTYDQLGPVPSGAYKALSVHVQRPEINNVDAINAPLNKSDPVTLSYLKAIKRADAPAATFTTITATHDGSIKFEHNDASANRDFFGEIGDFDASGFNMLDSSNVAIPAMDASRAVIAFDASIVAGVKYEMKAYSRFDLTSAGYDARYAALNDGNAELLSAVTTNTQFFTEPPSMTLTVRPTGATNEFKTVRMQGDANANDIQRLLSYAKDVCGQVLEVEKVIESGHNDSCGNPIYPSGSNVDAFNAEFTEDFNFTETISFDQAGSMFLLGIIDTPNQVDAILVDETPNTLTSALKVAIDAYDVDVVEHDAAVDACNNYTSDAAWIVSDNSYNEWTASGEALAVIFIDACNNVAGSAAELGSDLNVADLSASLFDASMTYQAMNLTRASLSTVIANWVTYQGGSASQSAKDAAKFAPAITYSVFEVSGNTFPSASTEIPIPNGGYSIANLSTGANSTLNTYSITVSAQAGVKSTANTNYNLSLTENERLKAIVASNAQDILDASGAAYNAEVAADARLTTLQGAADTTKTALVGASGTVAAPGAGSSVKAMNEARTALSNDIGGFEAFVVPPLSE